MRIAYFGTGSFGTPVLESLIEAGRAPVVIITAPDRPAGRGLKPRSSQIKKLAVQAGLPILQPQDVNKPEVLEAIMSHDVQLALIIAFGQKIGPVLIDSIAGGILNLHGSLLPKYRGAAPISWAIINGEKTTGLTVMKIDKQIDTGLILAQKSYPIEPLETAGQLHDRLALMGPELIMEVLDAIEQHTVTAVPQDPRKVSYARKLCKSDSFLDFNQPAETLVNRIRGLWPWPGAVCQFQSADGKRQEQVSLARADYTSHSCGQFKPGYVTRKLMVAAGRGTVQILELKPAGSKLMSWQDFVNGRHVKAGDRFVPVPEILNRHR